jgi:hypothetical protein
MSIPRTFWRLEGIPDTTDLDREHLAAGVRLHLDHADLIWC